MKKKLLMDDYFQNRELVENQNNLEAILRMESMDFINKNFSQILLPLFDEIIGELFIFIRTNPIFEEPIKTNNVQLISNRCNLLECLIAREHGFKVEDRNDIKKKFINHVFAFSLIWSISSSISEQGHFRIDDFVRKKFTNIIFPNTDNAYGFYIDFTSADFTFKPWHEITPPFIFDKDVPFYNMLVPTIDTTRYSYILEKMLCNEKRVFITGGTGVGKSVMIRTLLERIQEPKLIDPIYLIFSSATDSQVKQTLLYSLLFFNFC
jgi:dynein heavy chain